MKKKKFRHSISKESLIVTEDAIRDFAKLNTSERLQWLDEMRRFLSQTMPAKTKKIYEDLRKRKAA
ncbi:MAG: hypothetical protein HYZ83_03025 [Candidatus Omnitrophica bacterium]|nr:hypothetical protein [Candidatus Omnitrophota bacterium]